MAAEPEPSANRWCATPFAEPCPARLDLASGDFGLATGGEHCQHHEPPSAFEFLPCFRFFQADFGLDTGKQHCQRHDPPGRFDFLPCFPVFQADFGLDTDKQHCQHGAPPSGFQPGCRCLNLVAFVPGISSRVFRLEGECFFQSSEHPAHLVSERVPRGGQRLQRLEFQPARRNQSCE
jgi:hypothetical protein